MKAETQRGIAFERIVRIAQTLRGLRYGLTIEEINREISNQTGHDWHARTTHRDL